VVFFYFFFAPVKKNSTVAKSNIFFSDSICSSENTLWSKIKYFLWQQYLLRWFFFCSGEKNSLEQNQIFSLATVFAPVKLLRWFFFCSGEINLLEQIQIFSLATVSALVKLLRWFFFSTGAKLNIFSCNSICSSETAPVVFFSTGAKLNIFSSNSTCSSETAPVGFFSTGAKLNISLATVPAPVKLLRWFFFPLEQI